MKMHDTLPIRQTTHMTTTEYQKLYGALLARFATLAQVDDFIRITVGVSPDKVYSPKINLSDALGALLDWCNRNGHLDQLHAAALEPIAAMPSSNPQVCVGALPSLTGKVVGRDPEKEALSGYLTDPRVNIVAIVGWGGSGKSQLVRSWIESLSPTYGGFTRTFGWSFYAQGSNPGAAVSSDEFFARAFEFFSVRPDSPAAFELASALARSIRVYPTLLVLDGLEPLLDGNGEIRDLALKYLLNELTAHMKGLCVITTRPPFAPCGETLEVIELAGLASDAGAALLRTYKLRGTDTDLQRVSETLQGHPLSLAVVGNYIRDAWRGDAGLASVELRQTLKEDDGRLGRLLNSYTLHLKNDQLRALKAIALFDRPAPIEDIQAIRNIWGTTDDIPWNRAIGSLLKTGLLSHNTDQDTHDLHPLIRTHFAQVFRAEDPNTFRAAHSRLFETFRDRAAPAPKSLQEMVPLYRAIAHGCLAHRWEDAFFVLRDRIRQGDEHTSLKKLGAVSSDLAAFACFFNTNWEAVHDLPLDYRSWLENSAGVLHRAEGSLQAAHKLLTNAVETALTMANPRRAAESARNLASTQSAMGRLADAVTTIRQAIEFADASGDQHARIVSRTFYAHLLNRRGQLRESLSRFEEVERMQAEQDPASALRYHAAASYAALLVEIGRPQEGLVQAREALAFDLSAVQESPLDIALSQRSVARALAAVGDRQEASRLFGESLERLRRSSRRDHLAPGLLDRARFLLEDDPGQAERDVAAALAIAGPRGFRLVEGDAYLTRARVEISQGRILEAECSLERARAILTETGFELRAPTRLMIAALIYSRAGNLGLARQTLHEAREKAQSMGMYGLDSEITRAEAMIECNPC